MAAGRYDITIEQGTTFARSMDILQSSGAPLDLTGYTYACAVRDQSNTSGNLVLTLSVAKDSAVSGRLNITATAAQTATIPNTTSPVCFWDLQIIAPDTTNTRIVEGLARIDFKVSP